MANTAPIIAFYTTAPALITTLAVTGSGASGTIPVGTTSNPTTIRIYNNYANTANVADAVNCTLAAYDNNTTQGSASTTPVTQAWLQTQVLDYNGATTGADIQYFAIGGTTKHTVPVNSATIAGSSPNYISVSLQIVVPANAAGSSISQALWLECNYNL